MAINIFTGFNVAVAKQSIAFADAGITVDNITVIFLIEPLSLKSYSPTRTLNALTGFEAGRGYYIVAKADMDLSALVSNDPVTGGGTGTGGAILLEDSSGAVLTEAG